MKFKDGDIVKWEWQDKSSIGIVVGDSVRWMFTNDERWLDNTLDWAENTCEKLEAENA